MNKCKKCHAYLKKDGSHYKRTASGYRLVRNFPGKHGLKIVNIWVGKKN